MTISDVREIAFQPVPSLYQANFSAAELAERRSRVLGAIGEGIALVQGAPAFPGLGLFRQTNDFYYLTGVEVPHAYVLLDGANGSSTLYLPHRDAALESSEGRTLSAEDGAEAASLTGVDTVAPPETLAFDLQRIVLKRGGVTCYTPFAPAEQERASRDQLLRAAATASSDAWWPAMDRAGSFVELLRRRFPQLAVRDLSPLVDPLRLVKSEREIELCRAAGRLSALAVAEAMRSTGPDVFEYELAGLAALCYALGGARGEGYRAIIAAGHNAWFNHYGRLSGRLAPGELVLMDHAPDVAYYTSDIGRMWPVDGKYSPLQRLLYGYIVEYHKALIARVRPRAVPDEIMDEAAAEMRERIETTEFPEPCYRAAALRTLEFRGHLSHPVGMAVHDVGDYTKAPLVTGTVFSIDPQMWVPEVELYVRVEDTVVVTDDSVEVFTSGAPLELDEVEATMREPGILQTVRSLRPDWPRL